MEIACNLSPIKMEHSDAHTMEINPHCIVLPENPELFHPIDDNKNTIQIKEEVLCADDPEDGLGFELIDVGDLHTLKERLEEKIAAWNKRVSKSVWDPDGGLLLPSPEVLFWQEKYEKRIRSLQQLIESIVSVVSQEVRNSNVEYLKRKVKNLEIRLEQTLAMPLSQEEFRQDVEERYSAKSAALKAQVAALKNDKKMLKLKLKNVRPNEEFIEIRKFNNLQKQFYAKEHENRHLQLLIRSTDGEKDELRSCIEDVKNKLVTNEAKCRDLEAKCSILTRELESSTKKYITQATELAKERLDSDLLKTWLRDSLESRHVFKEQLAELNEGIRNRWDGHTLKPRIGKRTDNFRYKAKVLLNKRRKQNTEESYLNDRDNLLEPQECKWREIMLEFDVLRGSLSILEHDLLQKTKRCSFLEENCDILRAQVQAKETVWGKEKDVGKEEEESVGDTLINTCD